MINPLRRDVLKAFKNVHRARLNVFSGDEIALKAARKKINDEFIKCKLIEDTAEIQSLIKLANSVAHELKTTIVQARETVTGRYQLNITQDTLKMDNKLFDPNVDIKKLSKIKQTDCHGNVSKCNKK